MKTKFNSSKTVFQWLGVAALALSSIAHADGIPTRAIVFNRVDDPTGHELLLVQQQDDGQVAAFLDNCLDPLPSPDQMTAYVSKCHISAVSDGTPILLEKSRRLIFRNRFESTSLMISGEVVEGLDIQMSEFMVDLNSPAHAYETWTDITTTGKGIPQILTDRGVFVSAVDVEISLPQALPVAKTKVGE